MLSNDARKLDDHITFTYSYESEVRKTWGRIKKELAELPKTPTNKQSAAIAKIVQSMEETYADFNTSKLIPIVPIVKEWIEQLRTFV